MNIGAGFLIFPAALIVFFKDGPFSYSGIVAFWFPVAVFFGEIVIMIIVFWKVINQQAAREQALLDGVTPAVRTPMPVAGS